MERERERVKYSYLGEHVEWTGFGVAVADAHASHWDVLNGVVVLKGMSERGVKASVAALMSVLAAEEAAWERGSALLSPPWLHLKTDALTWQIMARRHARRLARSHCTLPSIHAGERCVYKGADLAKVPLVYTPLLMIAPHFSLSK